jgi:hypothetical protein
MRMITMNTVTYEKVGDQHRYLVALSGGRTAEVLVRLRRTGLQVDGGTVTGVGKSEEVSTFREAADWLSRFIEKDGSPRPGLIPSAGPKEPAP